MRFESRRVFSRSFALPATEPPLVSGVDAVAPEIAFLLKLGVDCETLRIASARAKREGICAARALMAYGGVSESRFYRSLAYYLGVPFEAGWPYLAKPIDAETIQAKGVARLDERRHWILAPTRDALRVVLNAHERSLIDPSSISLTTPAHLDAIVRHRSRATIAEAASLRLPAAYPYLSAKDAFDRRAKVIVFVGGMLAMVGLCMAPFAISDAMGLIFFTAMIFRLLVCAVACSDDASLPLMLAEDATPFYSVLVPLYQEAHMVDGLIAALERLDYPRAKLEVLILVEGDDKKTRDVLSKTNLPPHFKVVVVPDGFPRTKPRALNVGLFVARGSLLTVYDAEDRPDPDQLRRAACSFAVARDELACLQASLTIDNGERSLLARLFAIEYAALFRLFNVGIARLGLPMALGGTSNHFRVAALRDVGAWDAWNVTEDADLGLRLARSGYASDVLASATCEKALHQTSRWIKQRRRWTKGWLQTTLVLIRGGRRTIADFGAWRLATVGLMLINLVIGPILMPIFVVIVVGQLALYGLPSPQGPIAIVEATLSFSVIALGICSTLWCGFEGLRRSGQTGLGLSLPLLVPYQLLISLAAWGGIIDLFRDPYHWRKTEHDRD